MQVIKNVLLIRNLLCWLVIASRSSSEVNSGLFILSILDELDTFSRFVYVGDVGLCVRATHVDDYRMNSARFVWACSHYR